MTKRELLERLADVPDDMEILFTNTLLSYHMERDILDQPRLSIAANAVILYPQSGHHVYEGRSAVPCTHSQLVQIEDIYKELT